MFVPKFTIKFKEYFKKNSQRFEKTQGSRENSSKKTQFWHFRNRSIRIRKVAKKRGWFKGKIAIKIENALSLVFLALRENWRKIKRPMYLRANLISVPERQDYVHTLTVKYVTNTCM